MASKLPSFVELMASLGLQNGTDDATPPPLNHLAHNVRHLPFPVHPYCPSAASSAHFDSAPVTPASPDSMYQQQHKHHLGPGHGQSYPPGAFHTQQMSKFHRSPSIIISESESDQESSSERGSHSRRSSGGRNRLARYTPYQSQTLHTRRVSMPSLTQSDNKSDIPPRALSSSPETVEQAGSRRPRKLHVSTSHHNVRAAAYTAPISTYVRRRTPTTSPTSATFPHHHRRKTSSSDSASRGTLSIPTLPALFPSRRSRSPPFKHFSFPRAGSPTSDPRMAMYVLHNTSSSISPSLPRQHAGVRISTVPSDRTDSLPHDAPTAEP